MSNAWREYGVIGVLMVVSIGGYLYVSRNQVNVIAQSIEVLSGHLLNLVPEAEGRDRVAASLADFKQRVEANEVSPEQVEQFAASVLNLGSSGARLNADEAEYVIRLALAEGQEFPVPGVAPPIRRTLAPKVTVEPDAWEALGERLQPMLAFYSQARHDLEPDSTAAIGIRFYADQGMRVVVDDRYRARLEQDEAAQTLLEERAVSWRARFADATQAERERLLSRAKRYQTFTFATPDSGSHLSMDTVALKVKLGHIASLRRLESFGVVDESGFDSFVVSLETDLEALVTRSIPAIPPPVPIPPDSTRRGAQP